MKKIAILLIILMTIGIGFLSGCNQQKTNNENTGTPTISSFSVTPSSISEGGAAELQWNVINAKSVEIYTEEWKYPTNVTNLEKYTVHPIITTTYTLTAKNGDKETKATIQVIVEESADAVKFIGTWFGSYTSVNEIFDTTYIFFSNRTLQYSSLWISPYYGRNYDNDTGTWQIVDGKLVLKISGQTATNDYTFSNNNNNLTIAYYNGITVDFTKQ